VALSAIIFEPGEVEIALARMAVDDSMRGADTETEEDLFAHWSPFGPLAT
jgi:hypothetical protein